MIDAAQSDESTSTLVFLHGLGDTADGWASKLPEMLRIPQLRFMFPTAKRLSVPGMPSITSWFDASVLDSLRGASLRNLLDVDPRPMQEGIDYCHHLIREEMRRGVPAGRIFVGGFSQGGCVAVRSALSFRDAALGGCVAASTFLGKASQLPIAEANKALPVLCCHGDQDPVVPLEEATRLTGALRGRGLVVEGRTYPGLAHTSCAAESEDIRRFLLRRLVVDGGEDAMRHLSAKALKALMRDVGVDSSGCFEKVDLLERVRYALLL